MTYQVIIIIAHLCDVGLRLVVEVRHGGDLPLQLVEWLPQQRQVVHVNLHLRWVEYDFKASQKMIQIGETANLQPTLMALCSVRFDSEAIL